MSADARVFNAASIVLTGKNLIEASAGTGKTYAITTLFVRLLLEKHLNPADILVVTFTEAATLELRERV
ncbi:MAG TPA: UvrD-helicase domain-containing protein, partial [Polyangiaceae bacterium]|nr:UvrD-helicase domain-containing protein [Polyangiaceae bacterium]